MKNLIFKGVLAVLVAFSLNACSGEYYELKPSPCACNEVFIG